MRQTRDGGSGAGRMADRLRDQGGAIDRMHGADTDRMTARAGHGAGGREGNGLTAEQRETRERITTAAIFAVDA